MFKNKKNDEYPHLKRDRFVKRIVLICVVAVFLIINTVFILLAILLGGCSASGASGIAVYTKHIIMVQLK